MPSDPHSGGIFYLSEFLFNAVTFPLNGRLAVHYKNKREKTSRTVCKRKHRFICLKKQKKLLQVAHEPRTWSQLPPWDIVHVTFVFFFPNLGPAGPL